MQIKVKPTKHRSEKTDICQNSNDESTRTEYFMNRPTLLKSTGKIDLSGIRTRICFPDHRLSGPLLYELSYRINWEHFARFIQFKGTRDPRDNLDRVYTYDISISITTHASAESTSWLVNFFVLRKYKQLSGL